MKRLYFFPALIVIALICMSWGTTGHFAVGRIAERHLTPQAAVAVHNLLGAGTLADVSTWADDVRGEKEYDHTGKWHYINLPKGLATYADFAAYVAAQQEDNVYKAVLQCKATLLSGTAGRKEKVEALQFLVHFVGDLHQPMHVSRAEDRGGNSIQVTYRNQNANLHSVWDSKLLDDQGMGFEKIAERYDTASAQTIARWQQDDLMQWIWESYQESEKLYAEAEKPNGREMKRGYYKAHIGTAYARLEVAGIRLAGMLNEIFGSGYTAPAAAPATVAEMPVPVGIKEVRNHMGTYAVVCGRVQGQKDLDDLKLVNLGAPYPNQLLTVVLKGRALKEWKRIGGKKICVTGRITSYKGAPQIVVTDPGMIVLGKNK